MSFDPYKTLEESSCCYPYVKDGETEVEKLARGPCRCSGRFTHSLSICQNRSAHPEPPLGWGQGRLDRSKSQSAWKQPASSGVGTHTPRLPPSQMGPQTRALHPTGGRQWSQRVTCRMRHHLVFPCLPHFPTPQLLLPDTIPQINNFLRLSSWRTSHIEG